MTYKYAWAFDTETVLTDITDLIDAGMWEDVMSEIQNSTDLEYITTEVLATNHALNEDDFNDQVQNALDLIEFKADIAREENLVNF